MDVTPTHVAENRRFGPSVITIMSRIHFEAVAHRKDGSFALVSSALTGRVWDGCVWVFNSMEEFEHCPNLNMVATRTRAGTSDMVWLSGEENLLLASDSGELEVWNCHPPGSTLEQKSSLGSHDDMVLCLSKMSGGGRVVSGGADGKLIVWDVESLNMLKAYRGHTAAVLSVAASPCNPECFVSTSQDGAVRMWDLRQQQPARKFTACKNGIHTSIAWCSTLDFTLAFGSELGKVDLVDTRETEYLYASYHPHSRAVHRLAFAPWNSSLLASVSDDTNVRIQSIPSGTIACVHTSSAHADFVHGLSWHPSEHQLVTCAWDGQVLQHTVTASDQEGGGTGSDAASETVSKGTTSKEEVSVPMETTNGIAKTVLLPST